MEQQRGRILIVDDNAMNIDVLHRVLRKEFDLETAADGEECLAKVSWFQPQLVLLDVMMPGIDGYETCRRIKSGATGSFVQVILVSGKGSVDDRLNGYRVQADDYVVKPFNHDELLSKARVQFRLWNAHRELAEAQARLKAQANELEDLVALRTRQLTDSQRMAMDALIEAKNSAESANRAKSQFLANMSHEIRTPLTAILGFSELLARGATGADANEVFHIIKRNGEHLLSLIDDILDISRIEAGKLAVCRCPCRPRQLLSDIVNTLQSRADAKGLTLWVEHRGDIPDAILTDSHRLRQILVNLIGNAIKFTEKGSVKIVVENEAASIGSGKLRFEVADTGIGIADEHVALLFQPFSQADASLHRRFGGAGLGLAISKRLAEMLGGDVTVRSALEKGSVFTLTITTESADEARLSPSPANDDEPAEPTGDDPSRLDCSILLAEDGPDNQWLISFLLKKAGARVVSVGNGLKAVEHVVETRNTTEGPDLILMDMQMPVMDGYTATRKLRELGHRGPIIALTAHAMADDRQKCLDAGCNDYLVKPFEPGTLLTQVAKHVQFARPRHSR